MTENAMAEKVMVLPAAEGAEIDEILAGPGEAREVVGPRVGSEHRTMAVVKLAPGAATVELCHPGEAVWYVVAGGGSARPAAGEPVELDEGAMVHTEPGAAYELLAGEDGIELVGGPAPVGWGPGERREGARVRGFHRDRPARLLPMISRDARLVVFLGVGAETANMNYVRLAPGEANVPHVHAESEDTIFILEGRGTIVDHDNEASLPFEAGSAIHVPIGIEHAVHADRDATIVSVGGPCPPDLAMLKAAEGT
jgi:quercetin dioxygenase-like cupin family protein